MTVKVQLDTNVIQWNLKVVVLTYTAKNSHLFNVDKKVVFRIWFLFFFSLFKQLLYCPGYNTVFLLVLHQVSKAVGLLCRFISSCKNKCYAAGSVYHYLQW